MSDPRLYDIVPQQRASDVDAPLFDPHDPAPPIAGEAPFEQLIHPTTHRDTPRETR